MKLTRSLLKRIIKEALLKEQGYLELPANAPEKPKITPAQAEQALEKLAELRRLGYFTEEEYKKRVAQAKAIISGRH